MPKFKIKAECVIETSSFESVEESKQWLEADEGYEAFLQLENASATKPETTQFIITVEEVKE